MSWRVSLLAAAAIGLGPLSSQAQTVRPDLWCTDGVVKAGALSGNLLYIGGNFATVGPATGSGVPLDAATGLPPSSFARVTDGPVDVAVPDGGGGWFIGGEFTRVNGVVRSGLAHLLPDQTLSSWDPNLINIPPNSSARPGFVYALVLSGSTLYVGGAFTSIEGQARNHAAAIDVATGNVTGWDPNIDGDVYALAISGSLVYVGGTFSSVGGQLRSRLAAVDAASGAVTSWNPSPSASLTPTIFSIVASGSTVFVGGTFTTIGFRSRSNVAALDAATGSALASWSADANGAVRAMTASGSKLYVGGDFTLIAGLPRPRLAALDLATGAPDAVLTAGANGSVYTLALTGTALYVGGFFTSFLGQARNRIAAADVTTGSATGWNPNASAPVNGLAVSGSTVYAGGSFNILGGVPRSGLAALNLTTGQATSWNPNPNLPVTAMALSGSTLYVGGNFTAFAGAPDFTRAHIAAIDVVSGSTTAWNPGANDISFALLVNGSTVYVGGQFSGIGGVGRSGLAALDVSSNSAMSWNPNPSNPDANALAVSGSTIYVGGFFNTIGGQTRHNIAAIDGVTGNATAWDPDASSLVGAMLIDGPTMYVGGNFGSYIGGQPRAYLAALDVATGDATSWVPPPLNGGVSTLALDNGTLYLGGGFGTIGGQTRSHVAALDAATGALNGWNPGPASRAGYNAAVNAVLTGNSKVYVLGDFITIGGLANSNVAEVDEAPIVGVPEPSTSPSSLLSLSSQPNPFHGGSLVHFFLPRAAAVTLSLYDVSGREVTRLVDHKPFGAGRQEVRFDGRGLRSGVYVCWLKAGGESASRRMVLIP
jgi:hypothetical protein